jgi:hypothetical protein
VAGGGVGFGGEQYLRTHLGFLLWLGFVDTNGVFGPDRVRDIFRS